MNVRNSRIKSEGHHTNTIKFTPEITQHKFILLFNNLTVTNFHLRLINTCHHHLIPIYQDNKLLQIQLKMYVIHMMLSDLITMF